MRYAVHSIVIVIGLLASGCGTSTPTGTSSTTQAESSAATSLIGGTWVLVSIDGQHPIAAAAQVTASFAADDRVAGSAGCNRYVGRAAATSARLDVGPLAVTKMYCDGAMAQEQAYLSALEKAKTYRIVGSQLRVGPSTGVVSLVFERAFQR